MARVRRRHDVLLLLLFAFLTGYRLLLARSGQLYWPDEFRYIRALHLLEALRAGRITEAAQWMFGTQLGARPGYVLLSTIPGAIQALALLLFDVNRASPSFYRIPAAINVGLSIASLALFYRLLRALVTDRWFALLGTLAYGLLANTNLYARHLFPVEAALLLHFVSLVLIVEAPASTPRLYSRAIVAGMLGGFACTTYPGYDPFVVLVGATLAAHPARSWRHLVVFALSAGAVLAGFELVALAATGSSFLLDSVHFAGTLVVQQGAFEEGFRFIYLYLLDAEGLAGALLLLLGACYLLTAFHRRRGRMEMTLIGTAVIAYLLYAAAGVVGHRAVYYGRLLHMYIPALVIAAILAIHGTRNARVRHLGAGALLVTSIGSFVTTAAVELSIQFPRDVDREIAAELPAARLCHLVNNDGIPADLARCDLLLENSGSLFPIPRDLAWPPPAGFTYVRSWRHPLQLRAYWYEGFNPGERARFRAQPPEIRLFRRVSP